MDQKLGNAAQAGDIDNMYAIITLDPLLLETIDQNPFSQTPLHIAVLAGQASFAMELLNLKPSFLRKLNTEGYSPVHLAAIHGLVELVREILEFNPELSLIKGREWRIPLHCAVINGRVNIIEELISSCSTDCLKALTVRKETVLHLALKHDQIKVFEMLVEAAKAKNVEEIVNWKDREGNTILHLAAYKQQFQVMDFLLRALDFLEVVDIERKNRSGLTALDVLRQHTVNESNNVEIESILMKFGAVRAQDIVLSVATPLPPRRTSNSSIEPSILLEKLFGGLPMEKWEKEIENIPSETRNALMVVAVLIATVTFQVALSPPGGLKEKTMSTLMVDGYHSFLILFSIINSIGFVTSIVMITVLTRRFPLKALLRIAVLSMGSTFLCAIAYNEMKSTLIVCVTCLALLLLTMLLLQWIYFMKRSLKKK